jgi:hypothetical protein
MANEVKYVFPDELSEDEQFEYVSNIMDTIEESTFNELVFKIDINFNKTWMVEIYEHAEDQDEDSSFNDLELVDWFNGKSLKEIFDKLMERYV